MDCFTLLLIKHLLFILQTDQQIESKQLQHTGCNKITLFWKFHSENGKPTIESFKDI